MQDPLSPLNAQWYRNDFNAPLRDALSYSALRAAHLEHGIPMYVTVNELIDPDGNPIMTGEGIFGDIWNKLKGWAKKVPDWASKASKFYGSDVATVLKNAIPSSDENAADSFPGERHAILQLANGKTGTANFAGPGTQVIKRLKRGDKPRSYVDKVAKAHDVRYAIAGNIDDDNLRKAAVRDADMKMIAALKNGRAKKLDNDFNLKAAEAAMTGKVLGEEVGLLEKGSFGGKSKLGLDDLNTLNSSLKDLEQEGLGKDKDPTARLLEMALGISGKGARQAGGGVRQAGLGVSRAGSSQYSGGAIFPSMVIPDIFKEMTKQAGKANAELPAKYITAFDSLPMKGIAEKILPIMLKKGMGMPIEQSSMLPREIFKSFKDLLKKASAMQGTGKAASKARKNIIRGSGFWDKLWKGVKDFGKGFAYGFNKTKDILGNVAGYIPGIGQTVKQIADKIPSIPGAATSLEELKQQTRGSGKMAPEFFEKISKPSKMAGKGKSSKKNKDLSVAMKLLKL